MLALVGLDEQLALGVIEALDPGAGAVGHAERAPVLAAHDPVPGRELPIPDLEGVRPEAPIGPQDLTGLIVEPGRVLTSQGQYHGSLPAGERGPPVAQHRLVGGGLIGGEREPPTGPIQVEGLLTLAVADQLQRLPVQRVTLAPVHGQLTGAEPLA